MACRLYAFCSALSSVHLETCSLDPDPLKLSHTKVVSLFNEASKKPGCAFALFNPAGVAWIVNLYVEMNTDQDRHIFAPLLLEMKKVKRD